MNIAAPLDFAAIYRRSPFFAALADEYKGIARGARAAKLLAEQRAWLQMARDAIARSNVDTARFALHYWHSARREWAHLTRQAH